MLTTIVTRVAASAAGNGRPQLFRARRVRRRLSMAAGVALLGEVVILLHRSFTREPRKWLTIYSFLLLCPHPAQPMRSGAPPLGTRVRPGGGPS